MRPTDVVMLCYSCDSLTSLENIESDWLTEVEQDEGTEKRYLPSIIVGTKSDLSSVDNSSVKKKDVLKLGKRIGIKSDLTCSAKEWGETDGKKGNIAKVFTAAIKESLIAHGVLARNKNTCCSTCILL